MKKSIRFLVFAAVIFVIFYFVAGKKFLQNKTDSYSRYLSLFSETIGLVKSHYVEKKDPGILFTGAFRAMVSGMDPYSAYLDARQSQLYRLYQSGNICTTGMNGVVENNCFAITDIFPDSPADRAGLNPGDLIAAVDEDSLYSLSHWEMLLSLISKNPRKMKLAVRKRGDSENRLFNLETRLFSPELRVFELGKNTFMLGLRRFDRQGVEVVRKALENSAVGSKWIIDLRMYMGGEFASFLAITRLLVNRRVAMSVRTRDSHSFFFAGKPGSLSGHPCVFIISRSTILYAELLAHLLKLTEARLVGLKTTGFTPRLNQIFMNDGSSVLYTEGIYEIESRITLGMGVQPTFEIKTENSDRLLSKCIALLEEG